MSRKFNNRYRIPSARAEWYDYNEGLYFITICTKEMKYYFGKIENNEMIYSVTGKYAENCIAEIPAHFADTEIIISQVMPNHIHLLIEIQPRRDVACHVSITNINRNEISEVACHVSTNIIGNDISDVAFKISKEGSQDKMKEIRNKQGRLSVIIGSMKSAVTKFANENKIEFAWQTRFYDHIVRSQDELERIYEYIQNNIATWNNNRFIEFTNP